MKISRWRDGTPFQMEFWQKLEPIIASFAQPSFKISSHFFPLEKIQQRTMICRLPEKVWKIKVLWGQQQNRHSRTMSNSRNLGEIVLLIDMPDSVQFTIEILSLRRTRSLLDTTAQGMLWTDSGHGILRMRFGAIDISWLEFHNP